MTQLQSPSYKRKPHNFLALLLSFILVDEACNNYIFNAFSLKSTSIQELILYSCFLLISIIASPLQAGYSDFYCRKKSLVFSLSFSFLSLILTYLAIMPNSSPLLLLSFAIIAKAGLGNNLPLSWAAISDTQTKNFRFSLGLSTAMMAFGFFFIILLKKAFKQDQFLIICILSAILITSIYLCIKRFNDIRDKKESSSYDFLELSIRKSFIYEIRSISKDFLQDSRIRKALLTFMLWEISFYSILIVDVDMHIKGFENVSLSMLIGYLIGVVFLKILNRKTDYAMIRLGFIVSILSMASIFLLWPFFNERVVMVSCYFIYSLAAVFLAPSLFSILSRERSSHDQGKIYGLIDSCDTISFLIAAIAVITYNSLQINRIYLNIFTFTIFIISLWPYEKFKKIKN